MPDQPMPDQPMIENAATIVPVRDVAATVDFYVHVLGFERRFVADDGGFAIVAQGQAMVQLLATDDSQALRATANNTSIYLWVRGLDALYEQMRPKLESLPEGRLRPPFDQPYGMREFHVKDPDGCLLFFGEAL